MTGSLTWFLFDHGLVWRWCGAVVQRLRGRGVDPDRHGIERISADLCRLHRIMLTTPQHTAVRHNALILAYDDVLRQACEALGVDQHLAEVAGMHRELERLRVEGALENAGLVIRYPTTTGRT